ncbi:hypothetical protein V5799_018574 [Amblyomma americanum]|uniref:Uncharacterized protein n=1 Tax=Amblyomma americanum TaxID=6943 RepID=A0AAQ4EZP1_AMBAM
MTTVSAVKLVNAEIPSPTTLGETVGLSSIYELNGDRLYSVKWYKNDVEFYRFVPNDWPPVMRGPSVGSTSTAMSFWPPTVSKEGALADTSQRYEPALCRFTLRRYTDVRRERATLNVTRMNDSECITFGARFELNNDVCLIEIAGRYSGTALDISQ